MIKMKCRECKKNYISNEYKKTGNINGFCSKICEHTHKSKCTKSKLSDILTNTLNKLEELK
jgi:hypothetical protein